MSAFDGFRESWEATEPHPAWRIAKDALGLVLAVICAVSLVLLMLVILP